MRNFQIHFSHPWLLLLLIPVFFFTLFSYFKLNKRYRCTRNRIVSIVLHICVMFLSIFTLAGFVVRYEIPNERNEIILVVDKSDSEDESQAAIDAFVYEVLREAKYDQFNVGIVTFGFDQTYAVPLTNELDSVYEAYRAAPLPDVSATNVAGALSYARTLFTNSTSGKIVLVTDGKETDEDANQVIHTISKQGISVDVAYVPSQYSGTDAQVIGVTLPDYHVGLDEVFDVPVTITCNGEQEFYVYLYDNGKYDETMGVAQVRYTQGLESLTIPFKHSFKSEGGDGEGLHEIRIVIDPVDKEMDLLEQNNVYCTYHYMEVFDKILVVERIDGEADKLIEMLNKGLTDPYSITDIHVKSQDFPATVNELRAYDQIILNNIANKDMPAGFAQNLVEYVEVYGGGVFTVGGNDEKGNANAYNREDMYGTLYQELLPVEVVDYTPPIGVMIIIDRSGSMADRDDRNNTYMEGAKAGALACLDVLTERDYIGIMTLDKHPEVMLGMTPKTKESQIKNIVGTLTVLQTTTIFSNALQRAGVELRNLTNVAKRHIIIVSDGEPQENRELYEKEISALYNNQTPITVSIVGIAMTESSANTEAMRYAAETLGHGGFYPVTNTGALVTEMRQDLTAPRIKDINTGEFKLIDKTNKTSPLVRDLQFGTGEEANRLMATLSGYYGVKIKDDSELILAGEYDVPIYAQRKYGKGMVGSFMCDLQGTNWSLDFMENANGVGVQFIRNVVNNLMPTENIRPKAMSVVVNEDNYTNSMSILADLVDGQRVEGEIVRKTSTGEERVSLNEVTLLDPTKPLPAFYVTSALGLEYNYSRCDFVVKESGVYEIILKKVDASGNKIGEEVVIYKSFSYSEEYISAEETQAELYEKLSGLALKGDGKMVEDLEDPRSIFEDFVKVIACEYDPRFLFMILAIVLFLADIAVRKFKFKWPHEIICSIKQNKAKKK